VRSTPTARARSLVAESTSTDRGSLSCSIRRLGARLQTRRRERSTSQVHPLFRRISKPARLQNKAELPPRPRVERGGIGNLRSSACRFCPPSNPCKVRRRTRFLQAAVPRICTRGQRPASVEIGALPEAMVDGLQEPQVLQKGSLPKLISDQSRPMCGNGPTKTRFRE
jgi:hypothetical protein